MSNKAFTFILILLLGAILAFFIKPWLSPNHTNHFERTLDSLESESDTVRLSAARELGNYRYLNRDRDGLVPPALLAVYRDDPCLDVRIEASQSLVTYKDHPDVLPALKSGLEDTQPTIRIASAAALIKATGETEQWFPIILDCIAADESCIGLLRQRGGGDWRVDVGGIYPFLTRSDWDGLSSTLLAHLGNKPPDERFELIEFMHMLGIYDAAYVPDLIERLDPSDRDKCVRAAHMLADMGELGAVAIPEMLKVWDFEGDLASNIRICVRDDLVEFGPLLAPHLDELVALLSAKRGGWYAVQMIEAIGPEAAPAIPALDEAFYALDYRVGLGDKGGYSGYHVSNLLALGNIGPAAADVGVPLCLEYYDFLCARDEQYRGAPLKALGMMGVRSPEVMDVVIAALDETDVSARIQALVAAMRLSPDDPRFREEIRSRWSDDPFYMANEDLALALSYGDNVDLVLPFLRKCITTPHSQLHAVPVVEIAENLGPQAKDIVPDIVSRLRDDRGRELYPQPFTGVTLDTRICLQVLSFIGPDAAPALPVVMEIREHAKPCDVPFVDSVVSSITP
jgi:hypothetical protein